MTLLSTNYALDVTVAGITIVFGMLVLLVAIISIFGAFMSGAKKEKPKKEVKTENKPVAPTKAQSVAANNDLDDEIVAVISAAIYSMYEGTGKHPVIKAIRPTGRNPWNFAGLEQNIRSFF